MATKALPKPSVGAISWPAYRAVPFSGHDILLIFDPLILYAATLFLYRIVSRRPSASGGRKVGIP